MTSNFLYLFLAATVLMSGLVRGSMYGQPRGPTKTIHVHHFDAGSSGMSQSYTKHSSGGGGGSGSLIELLILSSILGGGGLLGGTTTTGTQAIGIPINAIPINAIPQPIPAVG